MSSTTKAARNRRTGGIAALTGGVLLILSVWLPWIKTPYDDPTGWDVYQTLSDAGRNGLYEGNFFDESFSPFFSGMTVLIAGVVAVLAGILLLMTVKAASSAAFPGWAVVIAWIVAAAVLLAGFTNAFSLFTRGPGRGLVDPGLGLYVAFVGGLIGFYGIGVGSSRVRG